MFGSAGVGWAIAGAVGSAVIGVVPSCTGNPDGTVTVTYGSHHLIGEYEDFAGDLVHGDRLDLVMVAGPGIQERCDHYGGVLEWHAADSVDEQGQEGRYVCTWVDF
jgi:hypothetical protein